MGLCLGEMRVLFTRDPGSPGLPIPPDVPGWPCQGGRKMWGQLGKVSYLLQLCDWGSAPTQGKEVKSQAWPGIRRDGIILGVWSIWYVKGTRLTPEAMPGEERGCRRTPYHQPLGSRCAWGSHHSTVSLCWRQQGT